MSEIFITRFPHQLSKLSFCHMLSTSLLLLMHWYNVVILIAMERMVNVFKSNLMSRGIALSLNCPCVQDVMLRWHHIKSKQKKKILVRKQVALCIMDL